MHSTLTNFSLIYNPNTIFYPCFSQAFKLVCSPSKHILFVHDASDSLNHPELYSRVSMERPASCSCTARRAPDKTLLAKAAEQASTAHLWAFIRLNSADLVSGWDQDGARRVSERES